MLNKQLRAALWSAVALLAAVLTACAPAGSVESAAPAASTVSESSRAVAQTSAGNTRATEASIPAPPVAEASTAAALPECTVSGLPTRTPGVLTLATALPLRPPWFTGTDPATGDGYEAQVARAIAKILGFAPEQQQWRTVDPQGALSGTDVGFDVFLDRVSTDTGPTADFSSGYYSITDSVVMPAAVAATRVGSPALTSVRTGVIANSTGMATARERGVTPAAEFASVAAAIGSLTAGTIDAVVVPTPDAIDIVAAQPGLVLVGQLPPPGQSQPDQFHVVLAKDSPLTPCVSAAVDRLRVEQTLDLLTQQWIGPLAPQLP